MSVPPDIPKSQFEGPLFNPPQLRRDVEVFKVQDDVYFQAYWKVFGAGYGPAVILYILGIETLKFDFYGDGKGHYHINPNNSPSVDGSTAFFHESSARKQITEAQKILRNDLTGYLKSNQDSRISSLVIDQVKLRDAYARVHQTLNGFLIKVPELSGL